MNDIKNKLLKIKENNLYREINYLKSPQNKNIKIDDLDFLLMSSNNYLALSNNEKLKESAINAIKKYGVGSGGSRLTTGSYDLHKELENYISKFFNRESSLVFNSGYAANVGTISAICDESYTIFSDELNHASIIDGCRLSKGKTVIFKHNDIDDLYEKIKLHKPKNGLIVTDGVFSMDGDICPLDKITTIAKEFNLLTMVDDAHGLGVIGKTGHGILEYFSLNEEVDIYLGTLSKAIGSEGGFVCGKKELIEFLKNKARSFIFSTSLPVSSIASSLTAFKILNHDKEEFNSIDNVKSCNTNNNNFVKKLQENIIYFKKSLLDIKIKTNSESAIIPVFIGDEVLALKYSKYMFDKGIFVPAIRYPTVPKGKAILRFCLMSSHTKKDLDFVVNALNESIKHYK
ncbi:MAG: pyridoxal phosphate-dependent aminotransferase family protein [Clostridium perfringens]|nr:pyridoxal phosphate-dependent aminotransferase family protein [Clostridium perfringens]